MVGRGKKKTKKAKAAPPAGISSLTPALLERILSLVPLKPRTRLKCVAKNWLTAITNLRQWSPPFSSSSGLVIFFSKGLNKITPKESYFVTFFSTYDDGTCTQLKSFAIDDLESYAVKGDFPKRLCPVLADSHNGLLLLRDAYRPRVYLCNPLLPDPAGLAELPSLEEDDCLAGSTQCGFFFDSSENEWNIVTFTMDSASYEEGIITCNIFSPELNRWEEVEAPVVKPPRELNLSSIHFQRYAPCFRCGRKMYWLFGAFLMVIYDFDRQLFRVVHLPKHYTKEDVSLYTPYNHEGLLYESEGCLYYCKTAKTGFSLWTFNQDQFDDNDDDHDDDDDDDDDDIDFLDDDDDDGGDDDGYMDDLDEEDEGEDKYVEEEEEEDGEEDEYWSFTKWVPFGNNGVEMGLGYDLCPMAFNEELQILYLHDQISTVFSCSLETLETRTLPRMWSEYQHRTVTVGRIMMGYTFPVAILN